MAKITQAAEWAKIQAQAKVKALQLLETISREMDDELKIAEKGVEVQKESVKKAVLEMQAYSLEADLGDQQKRVDMSSELWE